MLRLVVVAALTLSLSFPVQARQSTHPPLARGVIGTPVTVAVPGFSGSGQPETVSGPVGRLRPPPPDGITRTMVGYRNAGLDNSAFFAANNRFPLVPEGIYFYSANRFMVVLPDTVIGFEALSSIVPPNSCLYAMDGFQFTAPPGDVEAATSTFFAYLVSRPNTNYAYIEFVPGNGRTCNTAVRHGVIIPLGQWSQAHRQRLAQAQQSNYSRVLGAMATILTGTVVAALTAPRPTPSESIWTGRGGCPMFTERHYDNTCW